MKQLLKVCFIALLLAMPLLAQQLSAQNYARIADFEENLYGEKAFVNADFETMKRIKKFWLQEIVRLKNKSYEFALVGNGDAVLRVTIPARALFNQEDSLLSVQGDALLRPFIPLLRLDKDYASVIVASHSDNNGSEKYLDKFTAARARAVAEWIKKQNVPFNKVFNYGIGHHVPVTNDRNIKEREQNRRITLYLVPTKNMIKMASKGRI